MNALKKIVIISTIIMIVGWITLIILANVDTNVEKITEGKAFGRKAISWEHTKKRVAKRQPFSFFFEWRGFVMTSYELQHFR